MDVPARRYRGSQTGNGRRPPRRLDRMIRRRVLRHGAGRIGPEGCGRPANRRGRAAAGPPRASFPNRLREGPLPAAIVIAQPAVGPVPVRRVGQHRTRQFLDRWRVQGRGIQGVRHPRVCARAAPLVIPGQARRSLPALRCFRLPRRRSGPLRGTQRPVVRGRRAGADEDSPDKRHARRCPRKTFHVVSRPNASSHAGALRSSTGPLRDTFFNRSSCGASRMLRTRQAAR